MTKQDLKDAVLPVCLATSIIFSCACLTRMLDVQKDHKELSDKADTMSKTIQSYGDIIDDQAQEIVEVKAQIPQ